MSVTLLFHVRHINKKLHMKMFTDELYSGIASGRMLNLELYTHRSQKLNFFAYIYKSVV